MSISENVQISKKIKSKYEKKIENFESEQILKFCSPKIIFLSQILKKKKY
jgi:hypothetical protein